MTAINEAKVLRVGVVYNGKILDEQIFRKPETVYFGDTSKSHFVIPSSNLPSKFPVFYYKSGAYELVILEGMSGKIFLKGSVVDVEEAIAKGVLKKKGKAYIMPLSADARGKIVIGSAIILFQFITPPPKPPKLRLPRSIKGGWWQMIDWPYATIQVIVALISYVIISYMLGLPKPEPVKLEDMSSRFAKLIVPNIEEIKEEAKELEKKVDEDSKLASKKVVKKEEPEEKATVAKEESVKKNTTPRDAATRAKEEAQKREEMRQKVAGMGLLKLIGTAGDSSSGSGVISDVLGEGGKDKDIDSALAGVKHIGIATSSGQRSRKGDAGATEVAKIEDVQTAKSSGKVGIAKREEKVVKGAAKLGAPEVDGSMSSKDIGKVVRMNSTAVRRCYEKALKSDPTLKGKIAVTFMINAKGRVEMVEISDDTMKNASVSACIKSLVRRWRFPQPEGGPASVTLPFVFSPSN